MPQSEKVSAFAAAGCAQEKRSPSGICFVASASSAPDFYIPAAPPFQNLSRNLRSDVLAVVPPCQDSHKTNALGRFLAPLFYCGGNADGAKNVICPGLCCWVAPPHPHTPPSRPGKGRQINGRAWGRLNAARPPKWPVMVDRTPGSPPMAGTCSLQGLADPRQPDHAFPFPCAGC
jgi:hypothetical protein